MMTMTLKTIGTGSSGNCHILNVDGHKLILDAGVSIKKVKQALNFDLRGIEGVLASHAHSDHSKALQDFQTMGIPCFTPYLEADTVIRKRRKFGIFTVTAFAIKTGDGMWLHTNGDGTQCPIYGFLIGVDGRKLLYVTDFLTLPYTFKKQRLSAIIIACNHLDDVEYEETGKAAHSYLGHSSVSTVKSIIHESYTNALSHVVLCHLSDSADPMQMKTQVEADLPFWVDVDIAENGGVISLSDVPFT